MYNLFISVASCTGDSLRAIPNMKLISSATEFSAGDEMTLDCELGYVLAQQTGASQRTYTMKCEDTGLWNVSLPECIRELPKRS